jgi:hypothetical protein
MSDLKFHSFGGERLLLAAFGQGRDEAEKGRFHIENGHNVVFLITDNTKQ